MSTPAPPAPGPAPPVPVPPVPPPPPGLNAVDLLLRILAWLTLTVLLGTAPVLAGLLQQGEQSSTLLGDGDLFFVAVGVVVAALSELLFSRPSATTMSNGIKVYVGSIILVAVVASLLYADTNGQTVEDRLSDRTRQRVVADLEETSPTARTSIDRLLSSTSGDLPQEVVSAGAAAGAVLAPETVRNVKEDLLGDRKRVRRLSIYVLLSAVLLGVSAIIRSELS